MKLKKFNEMINYSEELKLYINHKIKYDKNIFFRSDIYDNLGEFIVEIYNNNLPGHLDYIYNRNKKDVDYSTIAIFYISSTIDENVLKQVFGEPLYHDEFGEGFEGEYDEDTEEYSEPERSDSYASYFVDIDGVKYHIGYDHRGTQFEVDEKNTEEEVLESMKKFILMCKKFIK